jgi:hypothetical protein
MNVPHLSTVVDFGFMCFSDVSATKSLAISSMRRSVVTMLDSKEEVGICLKEWDYLCNGKAKGRCEVLGEIVL